MENKQVNNQEKAFEDKRNIDEMSEMSIPSLYPHTFITSSGVGASDAFKKVLEEAIIKKGGVELVRNDLGQWTIKEEPKEETPEEWVWVTGYKGTDKDMKCKNDFQYEIGKTYDMPEDKPVITCESGFHMCLNLTDVYDYVAIGKGNRFFEVRALVRKSDKDKYTNDVACGIWVIKNNKLAAKSIEFIRELTADEILAHIYESKDWSYDVKQTAILDEVGAAQDTHHTNVLVKLGYAEPLAKYIVKDDDDYYLAVALDAQPGISMDTKITAIFSHI